MTIYFYFIYFGIFPVANDDQGDDGAAPVPKTLPLACQRSLAPDRHSEDDHGPIFFYYIWTHVNASINRTLV